MSNAKMWDDDSVQRAVATEPNMPTDTDLQLQSAASPQVLVVQSTLR